MDSQEINDQLQNVSGQGTPSSGNDFYDFIESVMNSEKTLLDFGTGTKENTWRIFQKLQGKKKPGFSISDPFETSRFFIDSEFGNVGISNDEPSARLHIRQPENLDALRIDDEDKDATPFIVNKDGKVGIGTTGPGAKLTVNGGLHVGGDSDPGDKNLQADGNLFVGGSLGIGTITPGEKLEVRGKVRADEFQGNGANLTNLNADNISDGTLNVNQIPNLDAAKITSGTLNIEQIPDLDAGKITSGTLSAEQIPNLDAGKITSGTLSAEQIPNLDAGKITSGTLSAEQIPNLDAGKITSGTLSAEQIPNLDAGKITSGTLSAEQIPNLDAGKITSGTLSAEQIPDLDAGKITSGTLSAEQIPNLDAGKITSGTLSAEQIPNLDAGKITSGQLTAAANIRLNGHWLSGDGSDKGVFVENNGNVGIGKTKPGAKLEIAGTVKLQAGVVVNEFSSDTKLDDNSDSAVPTEKAVRAYVDNRFPRGVICMWYGQVDNIPSGWSLCDGDNETPDLRSRFIVGADDSCSPHDKGKPDQHNHYFNIPDKLFSTKYAGSHSHKFPSRWYKRGFEKGEYSGIDTHGQNIKEFPTQSGGSHKHSFSVDFPGQNTDDSSGHNRPKWYALCFIMKL
ncbi:hypothetical protein [Desulfonema magnum]|uniref:hypothetical protein n=1 Tax=Desulfonema magnum TaxID=45655 RepID=UPI001A9BF5E7|nr:hypothetical protein [Desulfonema magnum]